MFEMSPLEWYLERHGDTDDTRETYYLTYLIQTDYIPVSYTHLDVYKRQAKASSDSAGKISEDANKSSGTVGKAMKSVRKKIGDAFKGAGNTAGKHLQSINRKVSGLSRSCLLYTSRCV